MSKKFKFLLALSLLVIFVVSISAFAMRRGMMGNGMRGMMDGGAGGMMGSQGGGMMQGMSAMNSWLSGETLPVDLESTRPPENEITKNTGKIIYETRCAVCHGLKGDGKGERANELKIKPRDFTYGVYKFRSTSTGELPTNEDLFKTISRGLHGTAMLPWFGLSTGQKWRVAYYIKTFSDFCEDDEKPTPVSIPAPQKSPDEYIQQGKSEYEKAKCWECHGKEGYGDGKKPGELKDDWQQPIQSTNFRQQTMKRGAEIEDIYLTIATGLSGTPMPSFSESLSQDVMLSLAYFIQSISLKKKAGMGMMMGQNIAPDEQAGMMIDHVMMPMRMGTP